MPTTYRCTACRFEADLGWYHHHSFDDGFAATTLLMCAQCGAHHKVKMALRPSMDPPARVGPRFDIVLLDVGPHRARGLAAIRATTGCDLHDAMLRAAKSPATLREDVDLQDANEIQARFESAGALIEVRARPPEPPPPPIPKRRDELWACAIPDGSGDPSWKACPIEGKRLGDFGEFDLEAQACYNCGARGMLVSEMASEVRKCPKCGEGALHEDGGWIS